MGRIWLMGLYFFCSVAVAQQAFPDSALVVDGIVVVGNETTKEYVILREMSIRVGGPLTTELIDNDKGRIYSLELFNSVDIDYTCEGNRATVFVRVSERWYIFPVPIIGFKYRDLEKLYYGLGIIHRNFRGRNEKVFASFALGFDRWISLSYQNPKISADDDVFFQGYASQSHLQNQNVAQGLYDQRVSALNATLGKRFGLYATFFGSFSYDRWSISDPMEGRTASRTGIDEFFSIGFRYLYDSRDVREYATKGEVLSFSVTKFGLGWSEVDLLRHRFDLRGYRPLDDGLSVCARAFGSFIVGGVTPPYLQSYFGYDERLRGYFKTVFQGEHSVGSSVELRIPVLLPRYLRLRTPYLPPEFSVWRYGLYIGVFADAGKIWYRTESFSRTPWRSGFGVGLHFLLPYSIVVRTECALNNMGRRDLILDLGASF